jgi:hypothetical protein
MKHKENSKVIKEERDQKQNNNNMKTEKTIEKL